MKLTRYCIQTDKGQAFISATSADEAITKARDGHNLKVYRIEGHGAEKRTVKLNRRAAKRLKDLV